MFDAAPQLQASAEWATPVAAPAKAAESGTKRAFDVVVAASLIIFLAPVLIFIALAVALDSRGPVIFRQRRSGLGGQAFQIFKFRSMRVMEDGAELKHATKSDARVTRVGAILRKTSLDELPQLFNVLRGDMSLIGPRPHALAHDTYYSALLPNYAERFRSRPGLTGLAQVSGYRGEICDLTCMAKRVNADVTYVEGWSWRMDLAILARTLPLLVRDPQAY
jgi:putative colanic acid biosynthesis UDP-glucose lipid carrier transferase